MLKAKLLLLIILAMVGNSASALYTMAPCGGYKFKVWPTSRDNIFMAIPPSPTLPTYWNDCRLERCINKSHDEVCKKVREGV